VKVARREFMHAAAVAGVEGDDAMSPAVSPAYLTGSNEGWPLKQLAAAGYRGLELTPACLDNLSHWQPAAKEAGLRVLCVNALDELRPYLTGSLSDAVERRRRDTLRRLLCTLAKMREQGIPFLVVAPSRLAEVYQSVDEARPLLVESLRELAAAGDTTILLAAAPFRLFASSAETAAIVDEVNRPNVAAALDVGHALLSDERPAAAANRLGKRLRYVQVHDADIRPGVMRLDRHLPLGDGSLEKEELRAAVGVRPFAVGITPAADPLGAARAALCWLE
jgi:sugar phosphate isomerase/epimerase